MASLKISNVTPYTKAYKELCFVAWYSAGRPESTVRTAEIVPADMENDGRKPTNQLLSEWRDEEGWDWRADELDAKAELKINDGLVAMRVKMLRDAQSTGKKLRQEGLKHIMSRGFDSSASAVSAVVRGSQLERESSGLSEWLLRMTKMDDKELTEATQKLLERLPASEKKDILDGEEISVEDVENKDAS